MGMFDKFMSQLPWNTYATREKELADLAREIFGEQGVYKDPKGELPDQEDFNPSDFDLEIYDKMLTDGQVKAGLDMIKLSTTAKGFVVQGDDPETKQYAEFINENFEMIRGNIEDVLGEMLTALDYGYSCTEKVFERDANGKIVLKKMKVLNPHSVRVRTDKFGDIEYVKQRVGSKVIKIPAGKVIWYAHDKRFGNPYGQSVLRTTYKHWFIKDKMYRFANIAYERYGTPLLVGKVQDAKDTAKMKDLMRRINGMTGLAISGSDDITAIQGSNADFIGYIEHHDRKIMESMLVPPMMLGLSRGQSGSYALSDNQFDVFMFRLQALQRDLKALIEEEIIRPLVDLNFPNVRRYPAFNFKPLTKEDAKTMAEVFTSMITAEVIAPTEDWIREELGFPEMSPQDKKALEDAKKEREKQAKALLDAQKGNGSGNSGEGSQGASKGSDEGK